MSVDSPATSWIDVSATSDFSLANRPYGAFRIGDGPVHLGVAIGAEILDCAVIANAGLLDDLGFDARRIFGAPNLDLLLAAGRATWQTARSRFGALLAGDNTEVRDRAGLAAQAVVPQAAATMSMPFSVADYVDFYASLQHAGNVGRMFRPQGEPLTPNWRHMPIGYHGRAGTIVVDATEIRRPSGQIMMAGGIPEFAPTRMLDYEVEVGFVVGGATLPGESLPIDRAGEMIFGAVLVNDWSARDLQVWEGQPLGPFLAKSFATTISPWVVPLAALDGVRVAGPLQDPPPLPYLSAQAAWHFDVELTADIESMAMRQAALGPHRITTTNLRELYWSPAQMLAHLSSNGAALRAGDLFATGTVSGADASAFGSLLEVSWRGSRPFELTSGESRTFLEDGDCVTLRGCARAADGRSRIGFGTASGRIIPAEPVRAAARKGSA